MPGTPQVTDELKQVIVDGVVGEAGNQSVDSLTREENKVLVGLLALRKNAGR